MSDRAQIGEDHTHLIVRVSQFRELRLELRDTIVYVNLETVIPHQGMQQGPVHLRLAAASN
ncbi:hypothetical protein J4H86_18970 [Spiractinospora alimapuensis]|uniref:hypothetical protein n=1 Tax=Spiractinospora alimapuensis TaxID=2820884 RepID=UPI001F202B42|nr:hypothetical protein [Spiractinospora alimapuensis]QVQ50924.1 hypothetical protein J4H86_18970 [Spiractinospora alimapuensis]